MLDAAGIAYDVYDNIKPNPTIENITAGMAAEVTINYVITDVEKNRKFVCVDPHDIPIIAIIDPDMSASMPTGLCASTGMDALVHSMAHPLSAVYDIPKSLSKAGVKREDIPFLAESAFNDACTLGNPRDVTIDEIIGIYESIF